MTAKIDNMPGRLNVIPVIIVLTTPGRSPSCRVNNHIGYDIKRMKLV